MPYVLPPPPPLEAIVGPHPEDPVHPDWRGEKLPVVSITEMAWPGYIPGEVEGVGVMEGVAGMEMVPVRVGVGLRVPVGEVEPVGVAVGVSPEVTLRVGLTVGVFDGCNRVGKEIGEEEGKGNKTCGVR